MPKSKHQIPGDADALRRRVRAVYGFIKEHRHEHSVDAMCRILEVGPSGYR
jgi:hypothetical protein